MIIYSNLDKIVSDWIGKSWNIVDQNVDQWVKEGFISTELAFNHAISIGLINKLKFNDLEILNPSIPLSNPTCLISQFLNEAFKVIGLQDWKPFIDQGSLKLNDVAILYGTYSQDKSHIIKNMIDSAIDTHSLISS
jgi:hypothetical protein